MNRRFAEIDALKSIAILTVVLIHSVRSPFKIGVTEFEVALGHLTRFAVPAFLMASGFLYAGDRDPTAHVARRLRRILVPYLLASVVAHGYWRALGVNTETRSWLVDLLLGSSMGHFYYIFVLFWLVLFTPIFQRLPRAAMAVLTAGLIAAQWWVDAATGILIPLFWYVRHPLVWWAYFCLGWVVRQHYPVVERWLVSWRAIAGVLLGITAIALGALCAREGPRLLVRTAAWLDVYVICSFIFCAFGGRERISRPLRYLSENSYPIYLFHLFFVYTLARQFPPTPFQLSLLPIALPWAAGVLGSIAFIAAMRALLGTRSRDWIGA